MKFQSERRESGHSTVASTPRESTLPPRTILSPKPIMPPAYSGNMNQRSFLPEESWLPPPTPMASASSKTKVSGLSAGSSKNKSGFGSTRLQTPITTDGAYIAYRAQEAPPAHGIPPANGMKTHKAPARITDQNSKYWMSAFCMEPRGDGGTCALGTFVPCALYGKTNWRLDQLLAQENPLDSAWNRKDGCNRGCWWFCFALPPPFSFSCKSTRFYTATQYSCF